VLPGACALKCSGVFIFAVFVKVSRIRTGFPKRVHNEFNGIGQHSGKRQLVLPVKDRKKPETGID